MEKILKFLISSVFNVIALLLIAYAIISFSRRSYEMGNSLAKDYTKEIEPMDVEIELLESATIDEVADILAEKGVIKSALVFKFENLLKGNNYTFEKGTYAFNTTMDSNDIVNALLSSNVKSNDIIITIGEGFTVKDIAEYLENKELVTAEEFITACDEGSFDYTFISNIPERENRLEGYLFPDTYYIAPNSSPETIINKMLVRFEEIYAKYGEDAAKRGLTMDDTIKIASIIEKEILLDEERPKASQVIYNRLAQEEKLQMCSTVLYVIGKNRDRILESDLQVESPYNTYLHPGLPVGPISNPGEACIRAAVFPSEGDLMYFVVKDDKTGEHVFTNDYDTFLEAKAQYNQKY